VFRWLVIEPWERDTMIRRIASVIALLLAITSVSIITLAAASSPAQAKDANCSDFGSQASAQAYFINHGGPNSDPDGLDSDGDGIACESNPCPCSTNTGGGGGGGGGGTPPSPTKKFHVIHLRIAKVAGHFKVLGKVPTYRGKFQLLRKTGGGAYRFYTRTKAVNPGGKVKIQVKGSKGSCFKASVPGTKKYKLTTKVVGCIR
jgi:hypothetical protein